MIAVNVGPADRIPMGEGRELTVEGRSVAVFRARSGSVHATQAACPHRGGPLAEGLLGGTTIVCPLHGFAFAVTTGEPIGSANTCPALRTYETRVDERGDVIVYLPVEGG
jgi:nitrite reductase (NADH) small subunit